MGLRGTRFCMQDWLLHAQGDHCCGAMTCNYKNVFPIPRIHYFNCFPVSPPMLFSHLKVKHHSTSSNHAIRKKNNVPETWKTLPVLSPFWKGGLLIPFNSTTFNINNYGAMIPSQPWVGGYGQSCATCHGLTTAIRCHNPATRDIKTLIYVATVSTCIASQEIDVTQCLSPPQVNDASKYISPFNHSFITPNIQCGESE